MHIAIQRTEGIDAIGMLREHMEAIAHDIVEGDLSEPDWRRENKFAVTVKHQWRGHQLTVAVRKNDATNYDVIFLTSTEMEEMGLQCLEEGDELVMKKYWWLAVNGSSVAMCPFPAEEDGIRASPTPEQLLGFPTAEEAAEWQQFLLRAPIHEVQARVAMGLSEETHRIIRPANPEPPSEQTLWFVGRQGLATAKDGSHRVIVRKLWE